MWVGIAFSCLGFLIGNLIGFTAESVTSSVLALLFAFGGGSAISFMQKLDTQDRATAGKAIVALSLACLLGLYVGIILSEYQLLSPGGQGQTVRTSVEARKYLRGNLISKAHAIDQQLQLGSKTYEQLEEAYEEMYQLIESQTAEGPAQ